MDKRDRELLARLGRVNTRLGAATVELLDRQEDGYLPPEGLRALARNLAELAADLYARSEQIEGRPVDRVILNAHPEHPLSAPAASPMR